MSMYKGFLPKFYLDIEKNIIRGKVINARDTITFYGATPAEAYQAFKESVDDYLAFCAEKGVSPEKPFSGNVLVRLKPSTHRRLSTLSQIQGVSINAMIQRALDDSIKSNRVPRAAARTAAMTKSSAKPKTNPKPKFAPAPKAKSRAGTR